ncbi:MAG: hypothetical protein WAM85_22590 [Terracidiphilus sp.]
MKPTPLIAVVTTVFPLAMGLACMVPTASAAPAYAITATTVKMPLSGPGSTQYAVTGIPLTGTLFVGCQYAGTATGLKLPDCNYGPVHAPMQVTAGQAVTGTIYFYPYGPAVPANLHGIGQSPWAGAALAAGLLAGFGLRRKVVRQLPLTLVALGALAGLGGISACGGSSNAMTPGTYQYTLTADNESNPVTPLGIDTSTTISVIVP